MSIGGGCSAAIFASRIDDDRSRLMSVTIAAAESFGPRSDQSFRVMKACAVFMPWPEKLKPVRKVTLSTPGRSARYFSTFSITASVRA
ncbi:histidinol dehydrogenase [Bradyrhizobium sp. LM2.9]